MNVRNLLFIVLAGCASLAGAAAVPSAWGDNESRPLIVFQISEAALNRSLNEPIERESAVDDMILNTRVVGASKTRGVPRVTVIDNSTGATFKVIFEGSTVSRTVGHHHPIVIHSRSQTDFTAEKVIEFEQMGKTLAGHTTVRSQTRTVPENITTSRRGPLGRIVLRRAWQQVNAKLPEANAIGQAKAEARIVEAFDSVLEARLAKVDKQIAMRMLVAAILPANSVPAYRSFTRGGYLNIAVFSRAPDEKQVFIELPELPPAEQPIQVWVHDSVVGKNIDAALGNLGKLRHLVTFPALGFVSAPNPLPRGPQWTVVDEWFVIQLAGRDR